MLKNSLLLFISFFTISMVYAQSKAEKAIQSMDQNHPQEKVYLQFNKENYIAGENIWFKAFVFNGYSKSLISTSLYVELYDSNKKLIKRKLFPLLEGEANGDFTLAEDANENVYYIRAYTTLMGNYNDEYFFLKPILVYNPNSKEKLVEKTSLEWTATAHPEGDTFINKIPTKVAIRLQSVGKLPKNWTGYLSESSHPDQPITSFKSLDQNVAVFTMTPEMGKSYTVTIADDKGQRKSISLPIVREAGVHLSVNSTDKNIQYTIAVNNAGQSPASYKIIGTIDNKMVYKANHKNIEKSNTFTIPIDQYINSVLQLTLFDENENVVAQRLCFVDPYKLTIEKPNLSLSNFSNAPNASNSIELNNSNYSRYTVLVQDAEAFIKPEDNLISTMWLTADFLSKIENASQYFEKNRNNDALDALLITEKWKRFNWQSIILGNYPPIKYKPAPYISYTGTLYINQVPAPNRDLNLVYKGNNGALSVIQVTTDEKANFYLQNMYFEDSFKVSYQVNKANARTTSETQVYMKPNVYPINFTKNLPANPYILEPRTANDVLPTDVSRYVAERTLQKKLKDKVTEIEEVKLKAQKKDKTKKLNDELSSAMFRSISETVFDFVNDNQTALGYNDIFTWLNGRVAGLTIARENGDSVPYIRGSQATIYIDEMKTDPGFLSSVSISDIAMVKVMKDSFGLSGGSSILIYTKRGTDYKDSPSLSQSGLSEVILSGYNKVTEFINTESNNSSTTNLPADNRSIIYYNPNLEALDNEPAIIKFINNDTAKKYRVLIIAFDKDNSNEPLYYDEIIP